MGYSIRFDDGSGDDEVFSLSTTAGLAALGEWVDTLPGGAFPALSALVEDGHVAGTDRLAADLDGAIGDRPPDDPDVLSTAENLRGHVGVGDPGETAIIVDDDGADGPGDAGIAEREDDADPFRRARTTIGS